MRYGGYINFVFSKKHNLKPNDMFCMMFLADLSSWAEPKILKTNGGEEVYYLLYREKLLEEVPALGSTRSISRSLNSLEEKGLIESINKNTKPSYRFTKEGKKWVSTNLKEPKKPNGGESKKTSKYTLQKQTKLADCKKEYKFELVRWCKNYCDEKGVSHEEFENFKNYHLSKGTLMVDWTRAFVTWVGNHLKRSKPNGGESEFDNLI